ncbi:O-methyltransferase-like protein [Aspergillus crustosus]
MNRIVELAAHIQQRTADIDAYLQENNLPQPSFDEDGPTEHNLTSEEMVKARDDVLGATLELHNLILGPAMCLRPFLNGVSLQAIYKYNIAAYVPVHGEVSFAELASKTGLSEHNIRRILRYAMVFHHAFREPREGFVAHTAASRRLREDPILMAGVGYISDEIWPSFAHTIPALENSQRDQPNETGWNHYHNSDKPFFEYYATHPDMAQRFGKAMVSLTDSHGNAPSLLAENYPWEAIGNGTVVDLGGAKGHVSTLLAQQFPDIQFVVQDIPQLIGGAAEALPAEVQGRVKFQAHDFFTEQKVHADIYLLRNILHNWSDPYAVRIIRAFSCYAPRLEDCSP